MFLFWQKIRACSAGPDVVLLSIGLGYSCTEKSLFPTPQRGHTQVSGMSSKAVPGAMPLSGSPTAGS